MNDLRLRKTWDCWSPGTRVDLIEYCDIVEGTAHSALVRIMGEQVTIPVEYLVERRDRGKADSVPGPKGNRQARRRAKRSIEEAQRGTGLQQLGPTS